MSPRAGQVASRRGFSGRLVKVDVDTVRGPDGSTFELELIRHPGAAAVVPLLSDPEAADPAVLLISQYRYAAGGRIWEIPAGVLEPGEEAQACARRELKEETGAVAGSLQHLTTIYTTPGFTDERIHLFLARDIRMGEDTDHEADEFIRPEPRAMSEALRMIESGEIVDGKTIVGLLYVAGFTLRF